MPEKVKDYISKREADKEMLESVEELTDKFTSELKTTIKTLKKLKKSIKNAKILHQNLIDTLIQKDVSLRLKDSQIMMPS